MSKKLEPRPSVIISTYNSPQFLANALLGFAHQSEQGFEIVIADDGSSEETKAVIHEFAKNSGIQVKHCWHPDNGFRKTIILNHAIVASKGNYLIFTDGDCIPRQDFVAVHTDLARSGYLLSGGVEYLSKTATNQITEDAIDRQTLFDPKWLAGNREKWQLIGKVNRSAIIQAMVRKLHLPSATFNGHNTSAWKQDIIAVNGFDERMTYGGLDRELGERLVNSGIEGRSVRYDAILVHQFHERPYSTSESWDANNKIRNEVQLDRLTWSKYGIDRSPAKENPTDEILPSIDMDKETDQHLKQVNYEYLAWSE